MGKGGKKRQERARQAVLARQNDELLATTRFTVAELLTGIHLANSPTLERRSVRVVLGPAVVLDFDQAAAERFGMINAFLRRAGTPVGLSDTYIAAVALVHELPILTANPRHFSRVPGLTVLDY